MTDRTREAVMREAARRSGETTLLRRVVAACRIRRREMKIADSTGAALTGVETLARAFALRRLLRRRLAPDERRVGILLPPTVAAVVANLALAFDGRTLVNLNYSLPGETVDRSIAFAGIRHVVTSRRFLDRLPFRPAADPIVLEDLAARIGWRDKAAAAALAYAVPAPLLARIVGYDRFQRDDPLAVVFTSGTTGGPKGAVLSWGNVESNVDAVNAVIRLRPTDVMLGVLPFFHAFGFTITLWTALANDVAAVYHTNPLEGRAIGALSRERHVTILLATPTFFRSYLHRVPPEDFASVDVAFAGGERLSPDLADAFERRFGVRLGEGYGATEMSPLISANIPPNRAIGPADAGSRRGTVGRPASGVEVRVTDLETGEPLGPNQRGMLWARGPNLMLGYLDQPEATAAVIHDGWYRTGDVATIDEDGFITIVGRISRFAKIGGEMVPFAPLEEALGAILGADETGVSRAAVAAVPDEAAGERIVVVHVPISQTPAELTRALAARGLPPIALPTPRDFYEVEALPLAGIGKVDLAKVAQIAQERVQAASAQRAARA
ncbi:MAG TPA: AMP-binding protein [Thermomicrobiales bacterium]|nr:AMP-binding protein [Thermomicrobiales bacterium]